MSFMVFQWGKGIYLVGFICFPSIMCQMGVVALYLLQRWLFVWLLHVSHWQRYDQNHCNKIGRVRFMPSRMPVLTEIQTWSIDSISMEDNHFAR